MVVSQMQLKLATSVFSEWCDGQLNVKKHGRVIRSALRIILQPDKDPDKEMLLEHIYQGTELQYAA